MANSTETYKFSHTPYEPEDYALVQSWCVGHERNPPLAEHLPITGFVIYCQDNPLALVFMYLDPSCNVAICDWAISLNSGFSADFLATTSS